MPVTVAGDLKADQLLAVKFNHIVGSDSGVPVDQQSFHADVFDGSPNKPFGAQYRTKSVLMLLLQATAR